MNRTKVFETERLILRPFKENDAEDMFKNYCNSEKVCEFLTWKPHGTIENTKAYLTNVVLPAYNEEFTYRWAIVLKELGEVVGCIDVVKFDIGKKSVTLGWVLGENFWGQGIMPEVGRVVCKYLFDEGFVRIQAHHNVKNPKSGRVMQKIGMTYEGTLRMYDMNNNGELHDCEVYSIVKGEKIK